MDVPIIDKNGKRLRHYFFLNNERDINYLKKNYKLRDESLLKSEKVILIVGLDENQ